MKVKPKQLLFSDLPKARKGKKLLKAQMGKRLGETGMSPLDLQTLPNNYFNELNKVIKPDTPLDPNSMNAFDNVQGVQPFNPTGSRLNPITWDPLSGNTPKRPTAPQKKQPLQREDIFNPAEATVLGLSAFDAALPDWYPKQQVVQPQAGYNPNLYGTGSQAIMQAGGRVPIQVSDPNDPRIQNYRDSMSLHNLMNQQAKYLMSGPTSHDYSTKYANNTEWRKRMDVPFNKLKSFNGQSPAPIAIADPVVFENGITVVPYEYTRPTQPVEYRPRRPVVASDVQNVPHFNSSPDVRGTGLRSADLSQKATKYSVTVRDENAPGKQRSVYFKDKKAWRDFMDTGAVSAISSEERDGSATAAGYRTMESGGSIKRKAVKKRKYQGGGIIPDNMSPFYPAYQQGGPVSPQAGLNYGPSYNFGFLNNTPSRSDSIVYRNSFARALSNPELFRERDVTPAFGLSANARDLREAQNWMGIATTNANVLRDAQTDLSNFGPNVNAAPIMLHQPRDTVKKPRKGKKGAYINTTGYRDGGPTAGNPFNIIPTGDISMQGVSQPINAIPLRGGQPMAAPMTMMPGQDYSFDADSVLEYPMRAGGQLSSAKAKEMLRDGTANGKKLTAKQKRYFGMVAAGKAQTGMTVNNPIPGGVPQEGFAPESFYQASAKLGHYKGLLNDKLKAKNPQAFGDYFKGLVDLRRTGKSQDAMKYVQDTPYDEYLTPEEVQGTLGDDHYNEYLSSLKEVNAYEVQQGRQPLYGTKEGAGDLRTLNYGRRFASLQVKPSLGVGNTGTGTGYSRNYNYDPNTRQVSFEETGDIKLRPQHLSPPLKTSTASLRKGGVIYDDGGQIGTMWGGNSELASYNPYDGGTVEFQGASHDNGGIGMHYNGQPVEVEGGEYAAQDSAGNLNIFGNMYLPGTRTKFKSVAKEIAKKEKNYDMLKTKGSQYVQESNPANKFERLKFNSGNVMMKGGELGQKDLAQKKEQLSGLQKAMLDTAAEFGLDAEKMSAGRVVKAKKGKQVKNRGYYQAGGPVNDPTMADRNNNPGNIKWSKFARKMGATKGPPAQDGGNFAVFPSREKGIEAMDKLLTTKDYKNLDIESAITKWTGGHPYNYDLSSLKGKKVGELSPQERQQMMSTMMTGEGTRYGPGAKPPVAAPPAAPPAPPFRPYGLPPVPGFSPDPQRRRPGTVEPPYDELNPPPDPGPIPSDVEPLHFGQIMGEIYGAATNSVEPVPAQRYEPQLYQPFQVSFQDRLNQNQNSFNALRRGVGAGNPSALGELAAQKYSADSMVKGDEFRTNQAIANDVTNKNVSLLNDAELKNLGIADTQMVRQSTARSKTRQMDQMIVNSLASKIEQNKYENKRLAAYENLYDYRFVPQDDGGLKATYYGPNAMFNFSGHNDRGQNPDVKTISRFDAQGNLKGYSEFDDYDLREQQRALDLEMKRRNLPLLQVPPLNKKGG